MAQVIATLSASHKVDGKLVYLFPTTTMTTEMPVIIVKTQDNTILYCILSVCIITLSCTFYKYITRASRRATVGLEITDRKSCVIINLQLLPYCQKFFHVCFNETCKTPVLVVQALAHYYKLLRPFCSAYPQYCAAFLCNYVETPQNSYV